MTRRNYARLAGFLFLFYIVVAAAGAGVFESAAGRDPSPAAKIAGLAANVAMAKVGIVLTMITIVVAIALGVSLYAITRQTDPDLALLGAACRVVEAMMNGVLTLALLALLFAREEQIAALLLQVREWSTLLGATSFAVSGALFSWLFLRARSIPAWLAQLGIVASLLLVITLPMQIVGAMSTTVGWLMWIPMLVFEVTLGPWLLFKGVRDNVA